MLRRISLFRPTFASALSSTACRMLTVHATAQHGFTSGSADKYEQGRPTYTEASLQRIADVMQKVAEQHPASNRTIVELGAGTGKFTDSIVPFLQKNLPTLDNSFHVDNLSYIATEPSEGFRTKLVEKHFQNGEVLVMDGTGEKIPMESHSVDVIIAAQAFHWMATTTTLAEVHRVLKKNGALVLVWNTYDYSKDWLCYVDKEILTPAYGNDIPRQQNGKWRLCFDNEVMKKKFSPLQSWFGPHPHMGDRDMVLNRIMSTSCIVEKNEAYQQELLQKLNNLLDTHPELETARKTGRFEMSYTTELVWTFAN